MPHKPRISWFCNPDKAELWEVWCGTITVISTILATAPSVGFGTVSGHIICMTGFFKTVNKLLLLPPPAAAAAHPCRIDHSTTTREWRRVLDTEFRHWVMTQGVTMSRTELGSEPRSDTFRHWIH